MLNFQCFLSDESPPPHKCVIEIKKGGGTRRKEEALQSTSPSLLTLGRNSSELAVGRLVVKGVGREETRR